MRTIHFKRNVFTLILLIIMLKTYSQSFVLEIGGYNMSFLNVNRTVLFDAGNNGKAAGSIHRYDNLLTKDGITIYGILKILETNNASIGTDFDDDNPNNGRPERFQPDITVTAAGGYVLYELEFFEVITNSKVYVSDYYLTGLDIDGSEFYEIGGYSSYEIDENSMLTITHNQATQRTRFLGRTSDLPSITFENTACFIARYNFPYTRVTFALGKNTTGTDRQYSAQFGTVGGLFTNPYTTWNPVKIATIRKTANTNQFKAGTTSKYTIEVNNIGSAAKNFVVRDTLPAGVTYVPNSTYITIPSANVIETYRDHFNLSPSSYSVSNGSVLWTGNWIESDDDNDPAAGNVLITGGNLRFNQLSGAKGIRRQFDLSMAQSAELEFDYVTSGMGTSILDVQLSTDGINYTSIAGDVITGTKTSTHFLYSIPSSYFTSTVFVRFITKSSTLWPGGSYALIDNLKISYYYTEPTKYLSNSTTGIPLSNGVPPNILTTADNITLHPGVKMVVTFDVVTDCNAKGTLVNKAVASCTDMYQNYVQATHEAGVDPSTIGAERCGPGVVTLKAQGASPEQDYKWYDAPTGGNLLQTGGDTYSPNISATTDYWVSFYNIYTLCESGRTKVTGTVSSSITGTPVISSTTSANGTAANSGVRNPTVATNNTSSGTIAWTNTNNVFASDNARATATIPADALSNYIDISGFGLSLSAYQIKGILVEIERRAGTANRVYDQVVQLLNNGTPVGSNLAATGTAWPSTEAYASYGGSTNLWGYSWQGSQMGNLGVRIQARRESTAGNVAADIDHVRITVYYASFGDDQSLSLIHI
ncbi:MAG: hypothetical protein N2662_12425, partial [Bacteroidales bacterium]|nr:hypothetical protein [Bacteroidales bacterium]